MEGAAYMAESANAASEKAMGEQRPPNSATGSSFFWSAFMLGASLAVPKALLLPPSRRGGSGIVLNFLVATHRDYALSLCAGAVAWIVWLLAWRPAPRRWIWRIWMTFATLCVAYAVLGFWVYLALRTPLTYGVFYQGGSARNMASSVWARATPIVLITLVLAPAVFLLIVRTTTRLLRSSSASGVQSDGAAQAGSRPKPPMRPRLWRLAFGTTTVVLMLAYLEMGTLQYEIDWRQRVDRDLAENPHWALIESFVRHEVDPQGGARPLAKHTYRRARPELLAMRFPAEMLADFQTVGERRQTAAARLATTEPAAQPIVLPAGPRPRNVILIVLESVGRRYLSCYGSPYRTAPRLEAEAGNSLILDRYYANIGRTDGSMATLVRSQYVPITWRRLAEDQPDVAGTSLAQVLRRRGYQTAFMSSADLTYVDMKSFLAARGFDEVSGSEEVALGESVNSWGASDGALLHYLRNWIERRDRGKPFFAMAWTSQTHDPYNLSPGRKRLPIFTGKRPFGSPDLNTYLNCISQVDELLGNLLDALRGSGIADDTLVIITGDHGESFGMTHYGFGHGWQIYDEQVAVPCIFWNPQLFAPGRRSDAPGAHVDLSLSILDLLGIHPSEAPDDWQGHSLFGTNPPTRSYFFAANRDLILGVCEGNWKYTRNLTADYEELYDLLTDPQELNNVAEQHRGRCQTMGQRLATWLDCEQRAYHEFYQRWDCFGPPAWAR
jgi:arylsulfatase A-like enzyme